MCRCSKGRSVAKLTTVGVDVKRVPPREAFGRFVQGKYNTPKEFKDILDGKDLKAKIEKFREPAENSRVALNKLEFQIDSLEKALRRVAKDPLFDKREGLFRHFDLLSAETGFGGKDQREVRATKAVDDVQRLVEKTKRELELRLITVKQAENSFTKLQTQLSGAIGLRDKVLAQLKKEKTIERELRQDRTDAARGRVNSLKQEGRQIKSLIDQEKERIRSAKLASQQSTDGFASSAFGATRSFASRLTAEQAKQFKRQDRARNPLLNFKKFSQFRQFRDKQIDAFAARVARQRDSSIVNARLSQLDEQAKFAGNSGNHKRQGSLLRKKQSLQLQQARSGPLRFAHQFFRSAQTTQAQIQSAMRAQQMSAQSVIANAQKQSRAAQVQLQAAQIPQPIAPQRAAPHNQKGAIAPGQFGPQASPPTVHQLWRGCAELQRAS